MDPQRKAVRKKLKDIPTVSEYEKETRKIKLTDEEYYILDMVFVKGYNYCLIGDRLGYSEAAIKTKVKNILKKFE